MLSHLELKVEQKLVIVQTWFENWEISMDIPLFYWVVFSHMMHLDQLLRSKNI